MALVKIIIFVLALCLLISIHEFGHFIVAKLFNVYCLEFSIGMGPAIFSKKFKKDSETKYSLRALPIGGYVSMAGEDSDNEVLKDLNIPYQRTINGVSPWKRALITAAGVISNFALAIILITIYIFVGGVANESPKINVVSNSIASNSGLSNGDYVTGVKDIKVVDGTYVVYEDPDCIGVKCDTPYFNSLYQYLSSDVINDAVSAYLKDHPDASIKEEITIVFNHNHETDKTAPLVRNYNNEAKSFEKLGINQTTRIPNFFEGLGEVFKTFGKVIVLMFNAVISLFKPGGFNNLGGVVSMYETSSQVADMGVLNYVWFVAIISINLGFFNLFPIPALDGARLYISIIEGITRKKLNTKVEGIMNFVGMCLLLTLMVAVTIKDIIGLF